MNIEQVILTSPEAAESPGTNISGKMFVKYHLNDLHWSFLRNSFLAVTSP